MKYCILCDKLFKTTVRCRPLCDECKIRRKAISRKISNIKKRFDDIDFELYSIIISKSTKKSFSDIMSSIDLSKSTLQNRLNKLIKQELIIKDKHNYYYV